MAAVVAIVGRPNVGKSTLFNRLTRSRTALVADTPGVTRDRHYGRGRHGDKPFLVVDTGGLEIAADGVLAAAAHQTMFAVDEADVVLFVVDTRAGLTATDEELARRLRRSHERVIVCVNKAEGLTTDGAIAEFHALGLGRPFAISAEHGDGITRLLDAALEGFAGALPEPRAKKYPTIAVIGRPNVGKSTLVNSILGSDRVVVFDKPGTTRDAISIDFQSGEQTYTLIDTAGVRHKGKVTEVLEKFSIIKTLQALDRSNVVLLVLDAVSGITEQDAHLADYVVNAGRAVVIVVNKWDAATAEDRSSIKRGIERRLGFLDFADVRFVSALKGIGVRSLLTASSQAYAGALTKMPTPRLTRVLRDAVARQAPPRRIGIRPKLRYAHQGGMNPPVVVIHGSALDRLPESYTRYLCNVFRTEFALHGTPLRVRYKNSHNPYVDD